MSRKMIISVIVLGCMLFCSIITGCGNSPESQVRDVAEKYLKYMIQACDGDMDALDESYTLFTPEIQAKLNDMKTTSGMANREQENRDEVKKQFRDKVKIMDQQMQMRYGFGLKDLFKDSTIENIKIQGDTALLVLHCNSKVNIEAAGLNRNNGMRLKNINGTWYIEHVEGSFF